MILPGSILLACLFAVYVAVFRPGYLSSAHDLAGLIFLQILLAAIWSYRQRFFPVLILVFLWAGTAVPLADVWTSGRWFVLAAGAMVGYLMYMNDRNHHFSPFHLVAFGCVVAALVSAEVSAYPQQALLKSMSLLLLFLYGSSGARLAVVGREAKFASGMLLGCEILIYGSAASYFFFHFEIFYNPNSLGAVMGVAALPLMLWGIFVSEDVAQRRRRTLAALLALSLLLSSYARAGIVAAAVSCVLLCIALGRYRTLVKGIGIAIVTALLVAALVPLQRDQTAQVDSLSSTFLYKGKREEGLLGSRRSAWDQTSSVIREHPWFGSGFGTSVTGRDVNKDIGSFASGPTSTREHGNSYLAITEWVGLLGVSPFFGLVILIVLNVVRVTRWMRRTGDPFSLAVPLAAVLAAGLIDAAFEDWLFAVGYYLCIFFWTADFILVDLLPAPSPVLITTPGRYAAQG
jgi:O-antigen ligase